ncbi:MAG: hypothetical protein JXB85_08670 [Anaerolineales bacterium]|nr:hypothetical protein [Anaerolineales bacterium]
MENLREQPAERQETGEGSNLEQQSLDDATLDPRAHIEQTGNYQQAEAIQITLETTAENASTASGAAIPAATGEIDEPGQDRTAKDPLTGKGGDHPPSDSDSPDSMLAADLSAGDPTEIMATPQAPLETVDPDPGSAGADAASIDGNEPIYRMDPDTSEAEKEIGRGTGKPADKVGQIGPQRIDAQLPDAKNLPLGMEKGGSQKAPGASGGTSGGGPPVKSPGGSKGQGSEKGSKGTEGEGFHSVTGAIGRWLWIKSQESGKNYVEEPDGKGIWVQDKDGDWWYQETDEEEAPAEKGPPQGDPIDGDFSMPYTGSSSGGSKPDPQEPVGGPDLESGHFAPVYGKGGSSKGGAGTPGDKDGDDDSGKFLESDKHHGGGMVDPGDLDYYTPNAKEQTRDKPRGKK